MASLGRLMQLTRTAGRNFSTTALRRCEHQQQGIPGSNLPFSIKNRYFVTLGFIVFFGSGLGAPFLLVRHQLLKD